MQILCHPALFNAPAADASLCQNRFPGLKTAETPFQNQNSMVYYQTGAIFPGKKFLQIFGNFFCDFRAFFPLSRCMPRRTIRRNAMIINPKAPSRYILCKTCRPIANKAPCLQKIRRTLSYRDPKTDWTEGLNPRKAMRKFPGSPRFI